MKHESNPSTLQHSSRAFFAGECERLFLAAEAAYACGDRPEFFRLQDAHRIARERHVRECQQLGV